MMLVKSHSLRTSCCSTRQHQLPRLQTTGKVTDIARACCRERNTNTLNQVNQAHTPKTRCVGKLIKLLTHAAFTRPVKDRGKKTQTHHLIVYCTVQRRFLQLEHKKNFHFIRGVIRTSNSLYGRNNS